MSSTTAIASCPDADVLGSYIDGTADERTMTEITAHLATCNECLDAVHSSVAFGREERLESRPAKAAAPRRRSSAIWLAAAAIIVAFIGLATFWPVFRSRRASTLGSLAAAAPSDYRVVEPRLTGFQWAAMQKFRDAGGNSLSNADPAYLKMAGAAGDVLARARIDQSADAAHAAGVAKLVLSDPTKAVGWLETASSRSPADPDVWSDLAAARLERALQEKRPADLPRALEAADRALALNAALPDARFNRALVLEKLELRTQAGAAWRAYLEIDPDSGWATEAREHLQRLGPPPAASTFRDRVDAIERAAVANDLATVVRLVDPYRQDARAFFEVDLGLWGKAVLEGHDDVGKLKLTAARQVGAALLSLSGESLLRDAVREIDSSSPAERDRLAEAHRQYREGRLLYSQYRFVEAEKTLTDAATRFEALGSPMADVARYYVAKTIFDQNRLPEARSMLERLLAGEGPASAHHFALDAQARAELGLWCGYGGRWREAIDELNRSIDRFSALREFGFAAATETYLAECYDLVAQRTLAWQHRLTAFDLLSAHPYGDRLIVALSGGVRAEGHEGHPAAALSLLTLELAEARRLQKDVLIADALRRRALALAQAGDERSAWRDLREARALADRGKGMGDRLGAENTMAEGVLTRATDPRRAITLLTSSIDFFTKADDRFYLPEALLERARAERAAHATDAAHRDLEEGIRLLEGQRAAAGKETRATIFDEGIGLFEEAVDSLVAEGEAKSAFAYAERGRAISLMESRTGDDAIGAASPQLTRVVGQSLPPGAVLIELMLVRDGVVEFVLSRNRVQAVRLASRRAEIESHVRALRAAIGERRDVATVREEGAWLDAALLAPMRSVLGQKHQSMIIVPDRFLEAVPWAALCEGVNGPWLVEQSDLTVAPSAALWSRDARRPPATSLPTLLAVSSSGGRGTEVLARADDEVRSIASLYRTADLLIDDQATASRFMHDGPGHDVIHFAGHAQSDVGGASLLFSDAGGAANGRVSAYDISGRRLDRTRLVVLAACGTASGDDERLDGVPTMARAFLTAGASGVVASLWPIDDEEAAALTYEFHRALRKSGDPATALRQAQRYMLSSANVRWRQPAAWSGVELLGTSVHV